MIRNVGSIDRMVRVVIGLALLSGLFILDGPVRFAGLIGMVPLLTAAVGFCPLYRVFRLSTCPVRRT
jgi:hypothetical protein